LGDLFNLIEEFGSEELFGLHFKKERDKIGLQCKCGCKNL
jgi:hypothetical protein